VLTQAANAGATAGCYRAPAESAARLTESSRCFLAATSVRTAAISAAASGVSCPRNAALALSSAAVLGSALGSAFTDVATFGAATAAAGCDVEIAGAAPGE